MLLMDVQRLACHLRRLTEPFPVLEPTCQRLLAPVGMQVIFSCPSR
jgi:hypothetical protein